MRKSLGREIAIVSAPLVLVGGLLGWNAWRNRLRTPQIALKVTTQQLGLPPTKDSVFRADFFMPRFGTRFDWTADVEGGPQAGYKFGWNEQIVAQTPRGPLVVWNRSAPIGVWDNRVASNALSGNGVWKTDATRAETQSNGVHSIVSVSIEPNHARFQWEHTIEQYIWPADTQSLEWRGEIVVIPDGNHTLWHSPQNSATLRNWASVGGAAHWKRTIPLKVDSRQLQPVLLLKQKHPRQPHSKIKEQMDINVLTASSNWRTFRRLVAFDGKTRRTLWTNLDKKANIYLIASGTTFGDRSGNLLAFDIGKIPPSWGEVTFLCDTVFNVYQPANPPRQGSEALSAQNLMKFEQQMRGYRVSNRLILRADKTKAPR